MKVKVFEIVKTGLDPLSGEMETTIQEWLDEMNGVVTKEPLEVAGHNEDVHYKQKIEIISTSQSQHLRENTVFVTVFYKIKRNS